MIQRIQSIYLLLAGLAMSVGMYLFPLLIINNEPVALKDNEVFLIMAGLSAGISLANIFLYKTRQRQVVLNRLNIILAFVLVGLILKDWLGAGEGAQVQGGVGMAMPLVSVILLVLANRGIMKDETLVRAADRLR